MPHKTPFTLMSITAVVFITLALSGCTLFFTTPSNDSPASSDTTIIITSPQAARDAALVYLRDHHGKTVPLTTTVWTEENITPAGATNTTALRFQANNWLVSVIFPNTEPQKTIYTVLIANDYTNFTWEGRVDAFGQVFETSYSELPRETTNTPTLTPQPSATPTPAP